MQNQPSAVLPVSAMSHRCNLELWWNSNLHMSSTVQACVWYQIWRTIFCVYSFYQFCCCVWLFCFPFSFLLNMNKNQMLVFTHSSCWNTFSSMHNLIGFIKYPCWLGKKKINLIKSRNVMGIVWRQKEVLMLKLKLKYTLEMWKSNYIYK